MADIREKIKKLLSLATSPNENEARDAMLKARELMAKNKLSEADFEDQQDVELRTIDGGVKWTTDSGDIWMVELCKLIANNYCCTVAWNTARGSRTHSLVIAGLGDDADLCKEVIKYAVGFVLNEIKILERKSKNGRKVVAASYAKGFILGLEMAFEEQNEQNKDESGWGLVVVKPKEVQEYENNLSSRGVRVRKQNFDPSAYVKGQKDGQNFNARRVLAGEVKE